MRYAFEWDPEKARANAAKHGIYFEEAVSVSVFADPLADWEVDDGFYAGEERFIPGTVVLAAAGGCCLYTTRRTCPYYQCTEAKPAARQKRMKADQDDDEMLPEYDFSNAVRGKFADWFTPEEREELLRRSIVGTARAWHEFALERVQALESALFTCSVVITPVPRGRDAGSSAQPFTALVRLVGEIGPDAPLPRSLRRRLAHLADECRWAAEHGEEGTEGTPAERLAHIERLERIGREAEAVKAEVDSLIQRHLARSGMSEQEIERTTEETAKLWLAA